MPISAHTPPFTSAIVKMPDSEQKWYITHQRTSDHVLVAYRNPMHPEANCNR